jgi:hypothetical protein
MDTIAQIRRAEASVLVHNPDRTLSLVQTLSPRYNSSIELLDLAVVVPDTEWNDLRDLYRFISAIAISW